MADFFATIKAPPPKNLDPCHKSDHRFFTDIRQISKMKPDDSIRPKMDEFGEYNILALHIAVINRLKTEKPKAVDIDSQIKIQKWIAENDPDPTERRLAQERLFDITSKKCEKDYLQEYTRKADCILNNYRELCKVPVTIDFLHRNVTTRGDIKQKLKQTAEEFIGLCQEYVPISLKVKLHEYVKCCDSPSTVCEDNTFYCANCGEISKTLDQVGAYKDQKRVSANTRQKYYNVKHFETAGSLYFYGMISAIILVGFLLIFIGRILEIAAYFSLPDTLGTDSPAQTPTQSTRRCVNCGRVIPEDAHVCPYCAKAFDEETR